MTLAFDEVAVIEKIRTLINVTSDIIVETVYTPVRKQHIDASGTIIKSLDDGDKSRVPKLERELKRKS